MDAIGKGDDQMTQSYFDAKADIWDAEIAEKDQAKLENMANRLDIKPGDTVLDVGSGTGIFVPFLLSKIGIKGKLLCVDSSEEMLEKARKKNFNGNNEIHQQVPELSGDLIPDERDVLQLLSSVGFKKINVYEETSSYLVKAEKQ